jgi:hypothetical protein
VITEHKERLFQMLFVKFIWTAYCAYHFYIESILHVSMFTVMLGSIALPVLLNLGLVALALVHS